MIPHDSYRNSQVRGTKQNKHGPTNTSLCWLPFPLLSSGYPLSTDTPLPVRLITINAGLTLNLLYDAAYDRNLNKFPLSLLSHSQLWPGDGVQGVMNLPAFPQGLAAHPRSARSSPSGVLTALEPVLGSVLNAGVTCVHHTVWLTYIIFL